ncbi:MAG: DUF1801 domain-containing protein [Methylobacteriaceae bacterium]|nr:DUF1801 domain-containing protein [Methylobacteriaceae bacterium]
MSRSIDAWIAEAPEAQRSQLQRLRSLVIAAAPDAVESLKWGQPCFARKTLFCYLQRARTHVTLGFQKGALMSDPDKRLVGDGKLMRHVRFGRSETIDTKLCTALIEEALRVDRGPP